MKYLFLAKVKIYIFVVCFSRYPLPCRVDIIHSKFSFNQKATTQFCIEQMFIIIILSKIVINDVNSMHINLFFRIFFSPLSVRAILLFISNVFPVQGHNFRLSVPKRESNMSKRGEYQLYLTIIYLKCEHPWFCCYYLFMSFLCQYRINQFCNVFRWFLHY